MKTHINTNCVILLIAAIALGAIACQPAAEPYVVGTEAELTGLSIGSIVVGDIPDPIDDMDWDDEDGFDMSGAAFKTAALNRISDTVNARFKPEVSRGARVEWGIGNQNARPFKFSDIRVPANFDDNDFLYFRVTSEDGEITQYYRFYAWVRSPVTDIASVYIGEYEAEGETVIKDDRMFANIAEGANTWSASAMGSISIRLNQSQNAEVEVVPFDPTSKIRYAITKAPDAAPEFLDSNVMTLVDQDLLYIEVAAQNEVDIDIYKFRVDVGRIATIKTLLFKGSKEDSAVDFEVVGKGTPAARWANHAPGTFETADQPDSGFGVQIDLDDPAAALSWALITGGSEPSASSYNNPAKALFDGDNSLAIKIVSDNGTVTRFYRIQVTLLAAIFTEQPKSDYYYYYGLNNNKIDPEVNNVDWYDYVGLTVDSSHANFTAKGESTVQPLDFKLDRTGTFTYQWYEANSWYGGYGFDADGRILYYLPGNSTPIAEKGFNENFSQSVPREKQLSEYFVKGFDEKKNVSLHNGGNQFYRMEYPGRPIPGATNSTYTPKIDYRPFIDGFTNEAHYYWVVVTDDAGRTATSKRAVIVSERDPTKKHHIVDVNYDLKEEVGGVTVVHPARNPKAFTYKREARLIPMALPSTFDVNDYTVATAQALFFLKDGTPWIQNWTQGDVGFYKNDQMLIIYYNLTNNNATLSLVGGGKEPQGASLEETPTHVVIKPAGEEPPNSMPPFTENKDAWDRLIPLNNNKAQGWFTAYIELVELRFEGPAR